MAYSGVTNVRRFTVQNVVDRSFRLCKLKPQQITSEMQVISQSLIYEALKHLPNRGIQSWTIKKRLVPVYLGKPIIDCPSETIDVLNANWRSVSRVTGGTPGSSSGVAANAFDGNFTTACITTSPDGNISYDFVTGAQITSVGICFYGSQFLHLKYQVSDDGTTWTDAYDLQPPNNKKAQAFADAEWVWFDVPTAVSARYSRIIETSGGTLAVRELVFGNNPQEIPLARLNRDDYSNLPNKYFPGRPTQYWLDRQAAVCRMNLYPVTDATNAYGSLALYIKSMIMDVTSLTQEIEMPSRWYHAFCYRLAAELANELSEVREDMAVNLEAKARSRELEAQTEDRDNSPIYYQPQIAAYTR